MVSGKCPHPWNKRKKGSFTKGHAQINGGKGCFELGRKLPEKVRVLNEKLGKQRYVAGTHPFVEFNKRGANLDKCYGIGKPTWYALSKKVRERDNWTCQNCKIDLHNRKHNCHHIKPFKFSKDNSESNLITLCIPCHGKIESDLVLGYVGRNSLKSKSSQNEAKV